jgi:predicted exporter
MRSFKSFLLSGVLTLVCLFVCFVCLCPMIDALGVNVVRGVLKSLKLKILSNYSLVKGKCVLDLLS